MNAVGTDQQGALDLDRAALREEPGRHGVRILTVVDESMAGHEGFAAKTRRHRLQQQHVQTAAMHRVLGPVVAGVQAARLGVDLVAVATDQSPLPAAHADLRQHGVVQPQIEQLAHRIRLQIDAQAQRCELSNRLEDPTGHADLVQRQRRSESADATAGDQHRQALRLAQLQRSGPAHCALL